MDVETGLSAERSCCAIEPQELELYYRFQGTKKGMSPSCEHPFLTAKIVETLENFFAFSQFFQAIPPRPLYSQGSLIVFEERMPHLGSLFNVALGYLPSNLTNSSYVAGPLGH